MLFLYPYAKLQRNFAMVKVSRASLAGRARIQLATGPMVVGGDGFVVGGESIYGRP